MVDMKFGQFVILLLALDARSPYSQYLMSI